MKSCDVDPLYDKEIVVVVTGLALISAADPNVFESSDKIKILPGDPYPKNYLFKFLFKVYNW